MKEQGINARVGKNPIIFNPRTRERCDARYDTKQLCTDCFNPRTLAGATSHERPKSSPMNVSIHAPARGATFLVGLKPGRGGVSIHAPARGATWPCHCTPFYSCCFNPRTRKGCDVMEKICPFTESVSIHAPARGAT